jgi:hypothetical protein
MLNFKKIVSNFKSLVNHNTAYNDYDETTTNVVEPKNSYSVISEYDVTILNKINSATTNNELSSALNELFTNNEYIIANTLEKVQVITGTQVYNLIANKLSYTELNNILRNNGIAFIEALERIVNQDTEQVWKAIYSFIVFYCKKENQVENLCDTITYCNEYMSRNILIQVIDLFLAECTQNGIDTNSEAKIKNFILLLDDKDVNYIFHNMPRLVNMVLRNPADVNDNFLAKMPSTSILLPTTDINLIIRYLSCTPFRKADASHLTSQEKSLIYKALERSGCLNNCNYIMCINLIVNLGDRVPRYAFNLYLKRILDKAILCNNVAELQYIESFTKRRCDITLVDMKHIRNVVASKIG